MIQKPVKLILSALAVLFFMLPVAVVAQDTPPPMAEAWVVTPKDGQSTELWKGLTAHMAFRSEHGDKREWQAYTPVLGDDLSRIAIRFCCFNWADQDTYDAEMDNADEINEHFKKHVAPHTATWTHYFESFGWENSHWVEGDEDYTLYAVTTFHLKPGQAAQFGAARDKMSQIALNQGWATDKRAWLWSETIGGKPQQSIIVPHVNYASMDRGDKTFYKFLTEHMSEAEASALLQEFAESSWTSDFQIWKHQEELSMDSDD